MIIPSGILVTRRRKLLLARTMAKNFLKHNPTTQSPQSSMNNSQSSMLPSSHHSISQLLTGSSLAEIKSTALTDTSQLERREE
jgi:hypothetical protein